MGCGADGLLQIVLEAIPQLLDVLSFPKERVDLFRNATCHLPDHLPVCFSDAAQLVWGLLGLVGSYAEVADDNMIVGQARGV